MGAAFDLEPSAPMSQNLRDLKEMQIARVALITDRTRLLNRLKTQTLAINKRHTTARLTQITRQIRDLDGEIQTRITADKPTARAHHILCSIPPLGHVNMPCRAAGIGAITAAAVLIAPLMICHANHCRAMNAGNRNHESQTGGEPRRSGTDDAPVRPMERQGVHRENDPPDRFLILCTPGRTQTPARRALHASPCRHALQPGPQGNLRQTPGCRKTRQGRPHRPHAKAYRTGKRPRQSRSDLGAKRDLTKTDTLSFTMSAISVSLAGGLAPVVEDRGGVATPPRSHQARPCFRAAALSKFCKCSSVRNLRPRASCLTRSISSSSTTAGALHRLRCFSEPENCPATTAAGAGAGAPGVGIAANAAFRSASER